MRKAILFIHGFNGEYEEYKSFIEKMNFQYKLDTHYFILPGHGDEHFRKIKYEDWIAAAEKELIKLLEEYDKVYIVGHSMGGVIGTYLCLKYKEVERLVLIAPAFEVLNIKQNIEDLKQKTTDTTMKEFIRKAKRTTPFAYLELFKLIKNNKNGIEEVQCPVMIIHGEKDEIVPVSSSYKVMDRMVSPKYFILVKEGKHRLLMESKVDAITESIYTFLSKNKYRKKYDYKEI